ncbi:hypothetical protein AHiyo4_33440 [Arthrobacter sp. Hiyo4]|nr:hypothetical protein AHiyo4_33440 [Arthrobacter sp. Hiyo4]
MATIGPSSRRILEAAGIPVALAPVDIQSAEGLVELWTVAPARVLLPQADIAAPGLRAGLAAKGADVTAVVAYHTVDYPAGKNSAWRRNCRPPSGSPTTPRRGN